MVLVVAAEADGGTRSSSPLVTNDAPRDILHPRQAGRLRTWFEIDSVRADGRCIPSRTTVS